MASGTVFFHEYVVNSLLGLILPLVLIEDVEKRNLMSFTRFSLIGIDSFNI